MATILQTTFSEPFSWMKVYKFQLIFHWSFVPKGPINNIPALVQIMAWHWPGDKPFSEPMMVRLLTHICVTRPQWVNGNWLYNYVYQPREKPQPSPLLPPLLPATVWRTVGDNVKMENPGMMAAGGVSAMKVTRCAPWSRALCHSVRTRW